MTVGVSLVFHGRAMVIRGSMLLSENHQELPLGDDCMEKPVENVIFLHGFLSSSLFWTETVFPNLSELTKRNYRLYAVCLLGSEEAQSRDCLYTLRDHLEMVEKSVIHPFHFGSFHLVAHSMGFVIALALAAKYSKSVKSVTHINTALLPFLH